MFRPGTQVEANHCLPARLARLTRMAAVIITPSPAMTAAGPAAALRLGARFVYGKCAPSYIFAVQSRDRRLCFAVVRHFDKAEAARASGVAIGDYAGAVNGAVGLEPL